MIARHSNVDSNSFCSLPTSAQPAGRSTLHTDGAVLADLNRPYFMFLFGHRQLLVFFAVLCFQVPRKRNREVVS